MSSRKMLRITLFGLLFIALAVVLLLVFRAASSGEHEIELPQETVPVSAQLQNAEGLPDNIEMLTVSAENVQSVIAKLERPEAYSRELVIQSFWDGGSAVYSLNVAVRDGATAIRTHSGGTAKSIIVTHDRTYIWFAGDRRPVTLQNIGEARSDEHQKMITYEDILALDKSQILAAGTTFDGASPGIFIRYKSGELGYVTTCTVSIELGLVTEAEQYDGDTLIYSMTAGECSLEIPGITAFTLPTGINVFAW